jgi:hypothetical protein
VLNEPFYFSQVFNGLDNKFIKSKNKCNKNNFLRWPKTQEFLIFFSMLKHEKKNCFLC